MITGVEMNRGSNRNSNISEDGVFVLCVSEHEAKGRLTQVVLQAGGCSYCIDWHDDPAF
jgi:hypothetical protein